jgi:hypothetical protein
MASKRVLISLPENLLMAVDRQAKVDYVRRSEFVRRALLEYLRPVEAQGGEQDLFTDPDELLRILRARKLRASLQQMLKDARRRDGRCV